MTKPLNALIQSARVSILSYLGTHNSCKQRELMDYVRRIMAFKPKKDGSLHYSFKPIYNLAIILAYKELEREGQIEIIRTPGIPFPATDYRSKFVLCH